jgi:uncharacterized membrane protein
MSRTRIAPRVMAGAFTASGIIHFVRPQAFESIMPRVIPVRHHRALIYVSGAAELVCAAGLWRQARWAPAASTALLLGVLPANVQMALDSGSDGGTGVSNQPAVAWGRLPLQLAMIWAVRQGGRAPASTG